jgi:hypothetical protein
MIATIALAGGIDYSKQDYLHPRNTLLMTQPTNDQDANDLMNLVTSATTYGPIGVGIRNTTGNLYSFDPKTTMSSFKTGLRTLSLFDLWLTHGIKEMESYKDARANDLAFLTVPMSTTEQEKYPKFQDRYTQGYLKNFITAVSPIYDSNLRTINSNYKSDAFILGHIKELLANDLTTVFPMARESGVVTRAQWIANSYKPLFFFGRNTRKSKR